jgi:hypothetical protein
MPSPLPRTTVLGNCNSIKESLNFKGNQGH